MAERHKPASVCLIDICRYFVFMKNYLSACNFSNTYYVLMI